MVAIGAPTNVASALLADPALAGRIVVVWLGGHALTWSDTAEFNLRQDPEASRVLLGSGVPLVRVPCLGVTDHMITTRAEIDRYVRPLGEVGALLAGLYDEYVPDEPGRSKGHLGHSRHRLGAGPGLAGHRAHHQPAADPQPDLVT